MMKIALISRGDSSSGGAGRVAEQLAVGLRRRGHDTTHFVRTKLRPDYRNHASRLARFKGDVLLRNLIALDPAGLHLLTQREFWGADVVHFHDWSVAFGALAALLVSTIKPTVLTLHDYSGLTGGCLYPRSCSRFELGCGQCPQLRTWPLSLPFDLTAEHFKVHRALARQPSTLAVTPSAFLRSEARRGAWANERVDVIPNAVDTSCFTPELRSEGRQRLDFDEEDRALLFVARHILDPRKGFDDLCTSFITLARRFPRLNLVLVGELDVLPERLGRLRHRVRRCGLVENTAHLSQLYAACDLMVVPSYQDNFPCTVLESMACGTPVLGYPTGGIPEMIECGRTGDILDGRSPQALTDALQRWGAGATRYDRTIVHRHAASFSTERFVDRHLRMYEELVR